MRKPFRDKTLCVQEIISTKSTITKLKTSTSTSAIVISTSSMTSSSINKTYIETLKQVEVYIDSLLRRLKNFERLINLKAKKFNTQIYYVDVMGYTPKKIEEKEQIDLLEKVKSFIRMIAAIVVTFSSLKIIKTLNEMAIIKFSIDSIYLEKYFYIRTVIRKRRRERQKNLTGD